MKLTLHCLWPYSRIIEYSILNTMCYSPRTQSESLHLKVFEVNVHWEIDCYLMILENVRAVEA